MAVCGVLSEDAELGAGQLGRRRRGHARATGSGRSRWFVDRLGLPNQALEHAEVCLPYPQLELSHPGFG